MIFQCLSSAFEIGSKARRCQRSLVSWKFWAPDRQRELGTPEALPTCSPAPSLHTACGFVPQASRPSQAWRMGGEGHRCCYSVLHQPNKNRHYK